MARVAIPALLRPLTGGLVEVEAEGETVRQVLDSLEQSFPGFRERLTENGRLRPGISVAIDGEIGPLGLLERVAPYSELHFVAAVRGGSLV